jgi:cholesterol 7-dehydrogenase
MLHLVTLTASYLISNPKVIFVLLIVLAYLIYYKKYGFYVFIQKNNYTQGKHRMGKTLPAYPNGWFVIMESSELKKGETKYVDAHGESLSVFRGNNGKAYVMGAYCPHLGANLGVEGKVVHDSCIQCPFHAWTFDGETGDCVIGKDLKPKEGIKYEYDFDCETNECTFKPQKTERIKIKKYLSMEKCGFIYVWFDVKMGDDDETDETIENPPYEPFDITEFQRRLTHRGVSLNKINCHVSDIAENGGDVLHFLYIHDSIIPGLVKGTWDANWLRGDDPKLREKMTVPNKTFNEYRTKLLDQFLTEENKKYIGVIHLENAIKILGIPKYFKFFFLTGFQVGPGLVYLFIKSDFFETLLIQHISTKDKYNQDCYHEIYCNFLAPYWFSALQLRLEVRQVLNDGVIWDNKKFGYKVFFNKNENEADSCLIRWRQWYCQFYKGCKQTEEKKQSLSW